MNVFDFALNLEKDGRTLYEKLANDTQTPELKNIFNLLAAAEEEHYATLDALKRGVDPASCQSTALDKNRNIRNSFQQLLDRKDTMGVLARDPDGFGHVLKAEEESIRLYRELADKETNPATRKLWLTIADEEEKHLNMIENIYEFVEKPATYLAWGEFGNLQEF
jgi:rubrerythrin